MLESGVFLREQLSLHPYSESGLGFGDSFSQGGPSIRLNRPSLRPLFETDQGKRHRISLAVGTIQCGDAGTFALITT